MFYWVKSFHIFFVICWFAGLFYLPRLFVWHAMTEDEAGRERFKVMERKLYRGIMTPCMVLTLLFGAWMIFLNPAYIQFGWMQAKIALVLLVVVYHHLCLYHMKRFREDRNTHSHVYFRWFNEAPTVVLLLIVILVVVKPF
jgi:protoporphyrinogen IX oxidase